MGKQEKQNMNKEIVDYCHYIAKIVQRKLGEKYCVRAGKLNKNDDIKVGIGIESKETNDAIIFIYLNDVYANNMSPAKAATYAIMAYQSNT